MIRDLQTLVLARLNSDPNVTAYGPGDVPNLPDTPHCVVYLYRRGVPDFTDRNRVGDNLSAVGWRIETLHVGSTDTEAYWMEDKVQSLLEDHRFTIHGHLTTPVHYEGVAQEVAAEPGVENTFTGTSSWTCVSEALQPA